MEPKYPSFKAINGKSPEPYQDFDPEKPLCQDDYEFFTGTGRYTDNPDPNPVQYESPRELCPYCNGTTLDMDAGTGGSCIHCFGGFLK